MIKRKQVADFTGDFDIKIQAKSSDQETEANLISWVNAQTLEWWKANITEF